MAKPCSTCGGLRQRHSADLKAGESLPDATAQLEVLPGNTLRRCPACRAYFLYTYDYEFGAIGDGWEDATLERVSPEKAIALLNASAPTPEVAEALVALGVPTNEAALTDRVFSNLDVPEKSAVAVRMLVDVHLGSGNAAGIERLLGHTREQVRASTLDQLRASGGARVFRAVRAARDPSPAARASAAQGAFDAQPVVGQLLPAVVARLTDPADLVRSAAAWALAVFAEEGKDVGVALEPLAARVVEDSALAIRKLCARALVAAATAPAAAQVVGWLKHLPESDELRAQIIAAINKAQSRTKRVTVCRCPQCGSTDAGVADVIFENTLMGCKSCGYGESLDYMERDGAWEVVLQIPINGSIPAFVAPLPPKDKVQTPLTQVPPPPMKAEPPPPPATMGCAHCANEDAEVAWKSLRIGRLSSPIKEPHFGVDFTTCTCGQRFAVVFTERVDFRSDSDDLLWVCLPLTRDEHRGLTAQDTAGLAEALTALDPSRRFLARNQSGGSAQSWWRDGGFAIGPHG